jgi:phosphoribosylpyrophosphate synthetase
MCPDPLLRALDAVHLASAQSITAVTAVLAYDKHLIDAARNAGLAVASPA